MLTTHLHRSCAPPRKGLIHSIFLALAEALAEANRPIWDAPASWIKK
jgi:hypothetical protein